MNYIKQVNTFYKLLPNNPLSSNAQCLYNYLLNKTTIKANSLFKKKLSHIYPDQVKYTVVENPTVNAFINIYSDVEIDEDIDEDLDNEA